MSILITGATGNVGKAVVSYLDEVEKSYVIGVRNPSKYPNAQSKIRKLDFEDSTTYVSALRDIKSVCLVRPPQLTDVQGIFVPFIEACSVAGVEHIVFLSLLGIEKNPFPPHYKIEKAIEASGIDYTFIRPSFFMQNLIEPHAKEIIEGNEIYIPSGRAKVSFIDTDDIGEIIGLALTDRRHRNKKYTITGGEAIDYNRVAQLMTQHLGRKITYANPGLLKFRRQTIKSGVAKEFANVMSVLYLTTKMGMAKEVTDTAEMILGRKPTTMEAFIIKNRKIWMP